MTRRRMGHHHAASTAGAARRRLVAVLLLTVAVLVAEVVGALVSGSLALLAIWFGARPATSARTFGYYRVEILAAVVDALVLFGVGIAVLVEAWRRLVEPPPVAGGTMLLVATLGLAANAASMWLLRHGQAQSLVVRGAYLEVLGDLLGSAAVVVAAALISLTGWRAADPVASVLVGLLILPRTWKLLRDAVDVLLEATPAGMDLEEVRRHIVGEPGVADCHDLHAWTITSGMPVLSAHVVLAEGAHGPAVLDRLGECLSGHFDVEHSTFQLEPPGHRDHEGATHP